MDKDEKDTVVSQSIILETGLITSSSNQFPFLFKNNSGGRFSDLQSNSIYQGFKYNGGLNHYVFKPSWELEMIGSASSQGAYGRVIQANFKLEFLDFELTAGLDEEYFGLNDSTLSIGTLYYGNNALPIPKLSLKTKDWVEVPLFSSWLSFKAYLAHGWFEKNRFQSATFLHQKYLMVEHNFSRND